MFPVRFSDPVMCYPGSPSELYLDFGGREYFKTYISVLQTLLTGGMPFSRHKAYSLYHNAPLKKPELRDTKSFTRFLTNKSQTEPVNSQQNQLSFSA